MNMEQAENASSAWNGFHSILVWFLGAAILITFSALAIVSEWLARIVTEVAIGLTPILVVYSIFKGDIRQLGVRKPTLKEASMAVGFGVLGVVVGTLSFYLEVFIVGGYPPGYLEFQSRFTPLNPLELATWILFSILVVAPCEEIFSRGFIQKGLEKSGGVLFGLIAASALFGLIHLDPFRIFPTAMEGLVLGGAYIYSKKKITVSAISHGVLNSVVFLLMFIFPYYFGL